MRESALLKLSAKMSKTKQTCTFCFFNFANFSTILKEKNSRFIHFKGKKSTYLLKSKKRIYREVVLKKIHLFLLKLYQ